MHTRIRSVLTGGFTIGVLLSLCGCDRDTTSSQTSSSADSYTVTESDPAAMDYTLTYDSETIPAGAAQAIAQYFYAIETQNYDLYVQQINEVYQTYLSSLSETDGARVSLEAGLEQCHQMLVSYAGTDDFTITALEMIPAQSLAEEAGVDEDFVETYMDVFVELFGESFATDLEAQSDALYDIAVTMQGVDADGNEITLLEESEIMVVCSGETYTILG